MSLSSPANSDVPIIGQLYTVEDFFVSAVLTCNCEAKKPVYISSKTAGACKTCHRRFHLQGIQVNNGQVGLAIGVGSPTQDS